MTWILMGVMTAVVIAVAIVPLVVGIAIQKRDERRAVVTTDAATYWAELEHTLTR